jgi:two-component system phosphate regulon sensor histidine kinase PhoR
MKKDDGKSFVWLSAVALVILLVIQVNWLLKTARAKEELFNEKASMVLAHTAQELCADKATCTNMGNCCLSNDGPGCVIKLGNPEAHKIDSLLRHFMARYNLRIDYSFEVIKPGLPAGKSNNNNVFVKRLEEVANQNGLDLRLTLPGKKTFILQEMGGMFFSSILLIVIIFILFIRTARSLAREKQISENTTEFLNNMTHEFKTPLTNINLAGKMILKESNVMQNEKVKHYTGIILNENEKLKQQAEQVLNLSALERGEVPLAAEIINMHALIEEALKCISVQIENREGQLKLALSAEKNLVKGDRMHLMNSVCNLVDNAIKYAKEKPLIEIKTRNADDKFILEISDNGIGIEKEFQMHIFEKFYRVPTGDVHDVKGFGLGLAYVKKIVELHGGRIELTSQAGRGSNFTITLPLASE